MLNISVSDSGITISRAHWLLISIAGRRRPVANQVFGDTVNGAIQVHSTNV
jgi:hypothetical protein